ncbi:hypothetical protein [Streptomyces sp. NPDC088925]|uniref:hypothetical protein n=1 Tax=Streptomyces sp. NPDC088925 TaxID=3365914 RepID=UPI00380D5ACA
MAANALWPVVLLCWLVLLVPAAVSLARSGTAPSADALRLPAMGMVLVVAHAVIGFALGILLPRVIGAPIIAVADWIAVAFTRATEPYWLRHVSGQFADISFGEVPRFVSVAAPVLLAGGVAVGLLALWLPLPRPLGALLGLLIAVSGALGAHHLARDWPHTPPMATGQAAVDCAGERPRLCLPHMAAGNLAQEQREAARVLRTLRAAGVAGADPARIDDVLNGPASPDSARRVWRLNLVSAHRTDEVGYQVMVQALRFRCPRTPVESAHAVWLWGANRTGTVDVYRERRRAEGDSEASRGTEAKVGDTVREVLRTSHDAQADWVRRSLASCAKDGA